MSDREVVLERLRILGLVNDDQGGIRLDNYLLFEQVLMDHCCDYGLANQPLVSEMMRALLIWPEDEHIERRLVLHTYAITYCERMGLYNEGIALGEVGLGLAVKHQLLNVERRIAQVTATVLQVIGGFDEACAMFVRVMEIVHGMGDKFLHIVALANIAQMMFKMGCYYDCIEIVDRALVLAEDLPEAVTPADEIKYGNTLFNLTLPGIAAATVLGNERAGIRCLTIAAKHIDCPAVDIVSRAMYECNRAIFLCTFDDFETADMLMQSLVKRISVGPDTNTRVQLQIAVAQARCDGASGNARRIRRAQTELAALVHVSLEMGTYHVQLLEELVRLHGTDSKGKDFAADLVTYAATSQRALFRKLLERRQLVVEDDSRSTSFSTLDRFMPTAIGGHDYLASLVTPLPVPAPMATERFTNEEILSRLRTPAVATAESWAASAEFFDDPTGQHLFRVGRLARMLASEIGLEPEHCVRIELAARLHDVGKSAVSQAILMKAGALDNKEMTAIKAHTTAGQYLLSQSNDPTLQLAGIICRHHHEWWNGIGYPDRLAGEAIPIEARIVSLADVYDALVSVRPYKTAWTHRAAVEQMMTESGSHHDPRLMRAFLKVLERYVGQEPNYPYHLDVEANDMLRNRRQLLSSLAAPS